MIKREFWAKSNILQGHIAGKTWEFFNFEFQ